MYDFTCDCVDFQPCKFTKKRGTEEHSADYDEYEDDLECDYKDSWFHRQYQETAYKNGIKRSVQEKLFTDKKLTFEEFLQKRHPHNEERTKNSLKIMKGR